MVSLQVDLSMMSLQSSWSLLKKLVEVFPYNFEDQSFFQQFWEKAPGQNWEKMIDFTAKLEEIHDTEHNKGSKIYPKNQVLLDCIMPAIPLKHKCLCIIIIWVIVSPLLFLIGKLGKKVAIFDWEWGRNSAPRVGQKMP